jgi:hypothetical protein
MECQNRRPRHSKQVSPVEFFTTGPDQTATARRMGNPAQTTKQAPFKRSVTLEEGDLVATSAPAPKKRRLRRAVRFSEREAEEIPSVNDESSTGQTWYNRQDYAVFREDMKVDYFIQALLKKRSPDAPPVEVPPDHCIRGLEKICTDAESIQSCKSRRQQRVQAVLDQQRVQCFIGEADPTILGTIAQVLSKRACDLALDQAAEDAKIWTEL